MDQNENRTRLEQYPDYQAAVRRYTELQGEFIIAERDIASVLAQISGKQATRRPASDLDVRAAARIVRRVDKSLSSTQRNSLDAELKRLQDERTVLSCAIALQKAEVEQLRDVFSREICLRLAPKHRLLVRAVMKAAIVLSEASAAEQAFRTVLYENDIRAGMLRPMLFPRLGELSDYTSTVSAYVLECLEFGFIERGDVPIALVKYIPPAPAPAPKSKAESRQNAASADGWLNA